MCITKLIYNSADYELNIKRYEKSRKTIFVIFTEIFIFVGIR